MDGNKELQNLKNEIRDIKEVARNLQKRIEVLEGKENGQAKEHNSIIEKEKVSNDKPRNLLNKIHKEKTEKHFELKLGQLLNRLGIIAVILGLSIFLKYSFDNQWMEPPVRIILGIILGVVLWTVGELTKKKYEKYAYGLLGGGSLAIFFSVYAGYSFYDLYSQVVAFIALIVVMTITVVMAVRHDSLAIGILGGIGGYSAPILVSSGNPSPSILFGYLTIVTVGVLGVAIHRKWRTFNYLSFMANQLYLVIWFLSGDYKENIVITMMFLVILFGLYLGISSIYNIKNKILSKRADTIMVGLNAFTFFMWGQFLLRKTLFSDYLGFYAILIACIYIILGRIAYRVSNKDKGQLYMLLASALVLITISIPLQLDGKFRTYAWLTESIALTFIGFKLKESKLRLSGMATFALCLFTLSDIFEYGMSEKIFFFNSDTAVLLFTIIITYGISYLYSENHDNLEATDKKILIFLRVFTLVEIFIFITIQNFHFFYQKDYNHLLSPEQLSLSGLWMIYAIVLFVFGIKRNNRYFRYSSLGLIGIIIIKAFLLDLAELQTIYKIILFIILGVLMLGISYVYQKKRDIILGLDEDSNEEEM